MVAYQVLDIPGTASERPRSCEIKRRAPMKGDLIQGAAVTYLILVQRTMATQWTLRVVRCCPRGKHQSASITLYLATRAQSTDAHCLRQNLMLRVKTGVKDRTITRSKRYKEGMLDSPWSVSAKKNTHMHNHHRINAKQLVRQKRKSISLAKDAQSPQRAIAQELG